MKQSNYEKVKEFLQDITASAEEYSVSEESPLAEFVSEMFYNEIDETQISLDRLETETADAVKRLIKRNPKNWRSKLREHCELIHVPDIYYRDSEILSATIGEQEHQLELDDEQRKLFKELTPEEFEKIKCEFLGLRSKQTDDSFWFYTVHDYERFALILDEESFLEQYGRGLKAVSNE